MQRSVTLIALIFTGLALFFPQVSRACHQSNLIVLDTASVNNGDGTFTITIQMCVGVKENYGGTNDFVLQAIGGTFSNFVSLTTTSINSSYQYCTCVAGSCTDAIVNVTSTATGTITASDKITFSVSSSTPAGYPFVPYANNASCIGANPMQFCWNITFVTNGYPFSIKLDSIENDVNPANGQNPCGSDANATDTLASVPCQTLNVTATTTNAGCLGICDGTAKITSVTNGGAPFTFSWEGQPYSTVDSATGLCVGTHTVLILDKDNCPATYLYNIQPSFSINLATSVTNVNCNGQSTGSITETASPYNPLYNYQWSNGSGGIGDSSITNLAAGTYTLTVTDDQSCIAYDTITVTQRPPISISISTADADCGVANGSATASASGGTPGFSYNWSTGATTATINSLNSGAYTVTVTDNFSCTATAVANVSDQNDMTISLVAKNNVSCAGNADGLLSISVSGSNPPFDISWSNGDTTALINNLAPGTYTVTVTDALGCSKIYSDNITENDTLEIALTFGNSPCPGANGGFINTNVTGGTFPSYSWNWSTGDVSSGIFSLGAGTYTVTVTDLNGCTASATQNITEPPPIVLTTSSVNSTCAASDGIATVSASGGTPGYTYSWNPTGQTTDTAFNLPAGIYSVTVTDANSCPQTACVEVNDAGGPIIDTIIVVPASCSNVNDGSIDITVIGGNPPYNLIWSNGETTEDIDSLGGGTYNVTVTDANGCMAFLGCGNNEIVVPEPFFFTTSAFASDCDTATGSAYATPFGGTSPYSFQWFSSPIQLTDTARNLLPGDYTVIVTDSMGCLDSAVVTIPQGNAEPLFLTAYNILCKGDKTGRVETFMFDSTGATYAWSNGATTPFIDSLYPGTYSVTVIDGNNCVIQDSATITEPTDTIALSFTKNDVLCNGDSSASITLTVTGGTVFFSYNYSWSNGMTGTNTLNNLSGGTYTVTVIDDNGCTETTSISIIEPPALAFSPTTSPSGCGISTGSIDPGISGGTPTYAFSWSNGAVSPTLTNLAAGIYTVTVTDANSCFDVRAFSLGTVNPPALSLSRKNVSCNGAADGSITAVTFANQFQWSTGAASQTILNLAPGLYSVMATDSNNCSAVAQTSISQPTPVALSSSVTDESCTGKFDGAAFVTASGGTPPYRYLWSTGDTNFYTINGLAAGAYSVLVTDSNSCSRTLNFNVNKVVTLSFDVLINEAACSAANGSATINNIQGGSGSYSYEWNTTPMQTAVTAINLAAGIYIAKVIDNSNGCFETKPVAVQNIGAPQAALDSIKNISCNGGSDGYIEVSLIANEVPPFVFTWSNGLLDSIAPNLPADTFVLQISDNNGCSSYYSFTLTEPPAYQLTKSVTQPTCVTNADGAINISINGATPFSYGYNYSWQPNGTTTEDLSAISSGIYVVTITDSLGCIKTDTSSLNPVTQVFTYLSVKDEDCGMANGEVYLDSIAGGFPPYQFQWLAFPSDTSDSLLNLSAGFYAIQVTDSVNCIVTDSIEVRDRVAPQLSFVTGDVKCFGESSGFINMQIDSGTAPFTKQWSNGDTLQNISGLSADTFMVMVTDTRGCASSDTIIITESPQLTVTNSVQDVTCFNGNNGAIDLTLTGGTPQFTFLWSNSDTTEDIVNLTAQNYTVVITDSNSCLDTLNFTINQPSDIVITDSVTNVLCNGNSNGAIDITVSGGMGSYVFAWSNSATSEDISNLTVNIYGVIVTDSAGCRDTADIQVFEPAVLDIDSIVTQVRCFGESSGSIVLNVTGGIPNYSYLWSNADTNSSVNIAAGNYSVTVTDANNCRDSSDFLITEPSAIVIDTALTHLVCNGGITGAIDVTVTGGIPSLGSYFYQWSNGNTSEDIVNLAAGNYTVIVSDSINCKDTLTVVLLQPPPVTAASSITDVDCNGDSTGAIDLTVSGGTPQYRFAWSNGDTTEDIALLQEGDYSVLITDSNNCVDSFSFSITQPEPFTIVMDSTDDCGTGNGTASVSISGGTSPYNFTWNTGGSGTNISNLPSGIYTVIVTDDNNCMDSGRVTVLMGQLPMLNAFPEDTTITLGQAVTLQVDNNNFTQIEWTPAAGLDNPHAGKPVAKPNETTVYETTITAGNGCTATDTLIIRVERCSEKDILVPNAFTPNGDNSNDIFRVRGEDITQVNYLRIFDRWGELLFSRENFAPNTITHGWDGKDKKGNLLNPDVFVYTVEATCPNGATVFRKGNVTLIR